MRKIWCKKRITIKSLKKEWISAVNRTLKMVYLFTLCVCVLAYMNLGVPPACRRPRRPEEGTGPPELQ